MYQSMNDYVYICVICMQCDYNYIEEKVERINNIYKNLFILIVLISVTLAEFWESIKGFIRWLKSVVAVLPGRHKDEWEK